MAGSASPPDLSVRCSTLVASCRALSPPCCPPRPGRFPPTGGTFQNPKLTATDAAPPSKWAGCGSGHEGATNGPTGSRNLPPLPAWATAPWSTGSLRWSPSTGGPTFDLLSRRILAGAQAAAGPPVSLFVFDVLRHDGRDLLDQPWRTRRRLLESIDVAGATGAAARLVAYSDDPAAMWAATADLKYEGVVNKRSDGVYLQRRSQLWQKLKHRQDAWMAVAGWRPPHSPRPAGLLIAQNGQRVGVAVAALPAGQRQLLAELLVRYGHRHATGTLSLPGELLEAEVHYSSRTPTRGVLREAVAYRLRRC